MQIQLLLAARVININATHISRVRFGCWLLMTRDIQQQSMRDGIISEILIGFLLIHSRAAASYCQWASDVIRLQDFSVIENGC